MIAKEPQKTYKFGDALPAIPGTVTSWPWPGSTALTKWSVAMLKYPLGTLIMDVVDGHPVIAQIQTHSWYGAHPDWPSTSHKGTSVFGPTTINASGKKVAIADPPDGWGEESGVAAYNPYPGVGSVGDPMESISRNGRPVSFGVSENFCPTLPYNCPPRPWGPDPGPTASIADRLGTGDRVGVSGCCPREWEPEPGRSPGTLGAFATVAAPAAPAAAQIRKAVQVSVAGRPQAAHPAVQSSIQAAANGAARAALAARPGMTPAQVHELARRGAEAAAIRASAGHRSAVITDLRHPAVSSAVRAAAHEAAIAHAWRPEWGTRPAGFGATQWRSEWGNRPAWFGARQWRGEWGDQPVWWAANQTAMATPQPDDDSSNGSQSPSPTSSSSDASSDPSTAPTAPGDASLAPSADSGLSTAAKIVIGVAAVAAVGGTVAAIAAHGKKKKPKSSSSSASPSD